MASYAASAYGVHYGYMSGALSRNSVVRLLASTLALTFPQSYCAFNKWFVILYVLN